MKHTTPKVSVCIPVYNGEEYIAETLTSVLSQTYDEFEVVVCDNRSTDNTEKVVRSFKDDRIHYVCNEKNLGLVGNANRAIELSRGEYVYIIHHDDVMLPENLAQKVKVLDEHPNVGFVHSNIKLFDQHGNDVADNIWCQDSRKDYIENGQAVLKRYLAYLSRGASIFIGAVMARKASYDKAGYFNPDLPHCNDSEMWMRMMLFGDVACIGYPLVKYRVHLTSASSSWGHFSSPAYFKEHFQAASIFFEHYGDQVADADGLKRKTLHAFSERAVSLANSALRRHEPHTCNKFLAEALKINPKSLLNVDMWKTTLKMLLYRFK